MAYDGISRPAGVEGVMKRLALLGNKVAGHLYFYPRANTDLVGTVEGRVAWDATANGLAQADGTQFRRLADRIVVSEDLMAASVDEWAFVADRGYKVLGFRTITSVVGGSGAVVRPRKVTAAGTAAPGDAAGATVIELTAADIDLTATVNVAQTTAAVTTADANVLAAGDKIGLNFGGTLTGLVGKLYIFLEQV